MAEVHSAVDNATSRSSTAKDVQKYTQISRNLGRISAVGLTWGSASYLGAFAYVETGPHGMIESLSPAQLALWTVWALGVPAMFVGAFSLVGWGINKIQLMNAQDRFATYSTQSSLLPRQERPLKQYA